MKQVIAVAPYKKEKDLIYQQSAFEAWRNLAGKTLIHKYHYPPRILHHFISHYDYIHFEWKKRKNEALLKFMGGGCPEIMSFPDHLSYEIIPVIWDCWPNVFHKVCLYFKRNKIKTAIFTSSMTAKLMQEEYPQMNILIITEGIDTMLYKKGKDLKDRTIDLIEFGRSNKIIDDNKLGSNINHLYSKNGERLFYNTNEFTDALSNAKITITLPRCDTHPEIAGSIETLTQRYWECMLSRIVMIGRAPFELTNLIGYNPVIDLDYVNPNGQIKDILRNLDKYQAIVDKNREMALQYAGWEIRIKAIMNFLVQKGYKI